MAGSSRLTAAIGIILSSLTTLASAADPQQPRADQPASSNAQVIQYHGYSRAIELKKKNARVVLCPQVGGRVLEFSVDGKDSMFMEDAEKQWQPGNPVKVTAGRFDYGPELTVIPHPSLWSGEWSHEITGQNSARLSSPKDEQLQSAFSRLDEFVR